MDGAQNVKEYIPEAVPDIFKMATITDDTITLQDNNLQKDTVLKIMTHESDTVGTIVDKNNFKISKRLKDGTESDNFIFVYGREVCDFAEIDYNHIFTLSVGAVQKLRNDIKTLKDELTDIKTILKNNNLM